MVVIFFLFLVVKFVYFDNFWFVFRLRPIDVEFMKRLDKCVNIVPVIAKADTLTIEEREAFRRRVRLFDIETQPTPEHTIYMYAHTRLTFLAVSYIPFFFSFNW